MLPNKLFQQLAMGKRVVTRASPAVDSLARDFPQAIVTVPPGDPAALAQAARDALAMKQGGVPQELHARLTPDAGVARLIAKLADG